MKTFEPEAYESEVPTFRKWKDIHKKIILKIDGFPKVALFGIIGIKFGTANLDELEKCIFSLGKYCISQANLRNFALHRLI